MRTHYFIATTSREALIALMSYNSKRSHEGRLNRGCQHLLNSLRLQMRQEPTIERATGSQKESRTKQTTQQGHMIAAPLRHRLGSIAVAQQSIWYWSILSVTTTS